MPCEPTLFEAIPIFSLLDAEERAVLAQHVELRRFTARQRIYRVGDPGGRAYLVINGRVHVIVVDADHQEVVIDSPGAGEMFGLASMLSDSPHETSAIAQEETTAIEVDRTDLAELVQRKPMTGLNVALAQRAWDPYPFILLNLFLSMLAAVQAPVIMMSQNRQDAKDRLRGEMDYAVNRKAETEIIELAAKLNRIHERLDDIHGDLTAARG